MGSTFDSNALSLGEYAIQSNDALVQKITYSLYETGNILQDIPLTTEKTLIMNGVRFIGNLPGVNWVPLNTPGVITKGKPTPYQEQVLIVRNQFQLDRHYVNEKNAIQNPLDVQVNAWMKAFGYNFNWNFMNNAHGGDALANANGFNSSTYDNNAPVGIRTRIDNPSQYGVFLASGATTSEMKIDAGGIDISPSGLSTTNANNFISYVQELLSYMDAEDGNGVTLYMNDVATRRFEAAVRQLGAGGGFDMTKDAFDRDVPTYRGAKIRNVGRKVDQVTRIILPTETAAGVDSASSNYTSIYGVKYGKESFCGWQMEPLKPIDLGLDPTNGNAYNTAIDWAVGLWQPSTRAIGRLFDVKVS